MTRYVAKPVEIEAVPISEVLLYIQRPGTSAVPEWVEQAVKDDLLIAMHAPERLQVVTRTGRHEGEVDDYLIKGTEDEIYPCEWSVFERKYRRIHG